MNTMEKTVIKRIDWLSQETEMVLFCEVQSGNLFYNTSIALPCSELNKVICELQKQNPNVDIQDCLKIEQWTEEDMNFVYDFSLYQNEEFLLHTPSLEFEFRQIRA